MTSWPGRAVLQVPVPVLDGPVRARFERDDPALLGPTGLVHAHVTVLGPVPRDADLGPVLAQFDAFDYVLDEVATFPNGIVHVHPRDPAPFRRLTALAMAALPGVRPYGGEFVPEPHVTIDAVGAGVTEADVRAELSPLLPLRGRADAVELVWYRRGETRRLARHPLHDASRSPAPDQPCR